MQSRELDMGGETTAKWDAGRMLGVQALAYVVLVLTSVCGPLADVVFYGLAVVALVVLVAFHVCWPFRAGMADRVIGFVAGLLSLIAVATPVSTLLLPMNARMFASALHRNTYPMARWAAAVAGLLVLLIIVSFARQMLRAERSHLIRALSHCVTGGAASISLAGWVFLPYVVASQSVVELVIVPKFMALVAIMVVVALVLAYASTFWLKELDPDPSVRAPWVGVALLPVMLFGLMVFAAALLIQVVGW
ncbi:hypothetical protein [Bifidobacterium panos]|uniref:Transporter n=1 Tax=Bifidobacterium panos TaxID=2675321 RepID=A0ABX1SXT3_9BIFI|nr:hypothetical protein [Bifidobacterium sp. DSM 109963]NMN01952.1 hypothetical protein [Bifidobacterium sp. DSM 109963]